MKKVIRFLGIALFALLLLFAVNDSAKAVADPVIKVVGDRVSVTYKGDPSKDYVVKIANEKDAYMSSRLIAKGKEETFPMFNGNAKYMVSVLFLNPESGGYKPIARQEVVIKDAKTSDPYLSASQYVDFGVAPKTTGQAKKLEQNNKDKIAAVWDYMRNNYLYDYETLKKGLPSGHLPDLDYIFDTKKGVCMDTAAEMAGMLRFLGVPTRYIFGKAAGIEGDHAWIEVQIDKKWVLIDISVDIQKVEFGVKDNKMGDDPSKYKASKIY